MSENGTFLSIQEKNWIEERRVTRLTDNKEVQIYPMGAERYLSSVLCDNKKKRYDIKSDIEGKNVLVVPGHGTSGFLFAQAGAKTVSVYDKDPVTIAWVKAFKKYYHYKKGGTDSPYPSVGELLAALNQWYPPLVALPFGKLTNILFWIVQPNLLRRVYIHHILSLICEAVRSKAKDDFELDQNIQFHTGTIDKIVRDKEKPLFDTAFVPYLLGVQNGIEHEKEIVLFMKQLNLLVPKGRVLVTPSQKIKEFYITGKCYFETTAHQNIQSIPELSPYFKIEDKYWFRTQGLALFSANDV